MLPKEDAAKSLRASRGLAALPSLRAIGGPGCESMRGAGGFCRAPAREWLRKRSAGDELRGDLSSGKVRKASEGGGEGGGIEVIEAAALKAALRSFCGSSRAGLKSAAQMKTACHALLKIAAQLGLAQ